MYTLTFGKNFPSINTHAIHILGKFMNYLKNAMHKAKGLRNLEFSSSYEEDYLASLDCNC
jgi:hypothetical protein